MSKSSKPPMSERIFAQIHDMFFKHVSQKAENVAALLQADSRAELLEIIDWSTLRLEPSALVFFGIQRKETDLVYSAALKQTGLAARILLLFEHKSYQDKNLVRQVAVDQFLLYMKSDFASPVIPVVVRQHESGGIDRIEFEDLFADLPKRHLAVLAEFSMNFRCLLIDVHELDRRGLVDGTRIDAFIRAMSIGRNFDTGEWADLIGRIKHVPESERSHALQSVIGYICQCNDDIEPEDVLSFETNTLEEQQMVRSAVDAFREEGRVEGLEQGRQEIASNLLQRGIDTREVADITKLDRDQVELLRRKMPRP